MGMGWCEKEMVFGKNSAKSGINENHMNDTIPKAIPLSECLTQCPHLARHANTDKLIELARIHRL